MAKYKNKLIINLMKELNVQSAFKKGFSHKYVYLTVKNPFSIKVFGKAVLIIFQRVLFSLY